MGQSGSRIRVDTRAGGSSEVDVELYPIQPANKVKVLDGDNATRNILLVGTSGRGKSSTGNSVFGEDLFETSDSMETDPDSIVCQSKEVDGLKLTVCDALTILDQRMLKLEAQADIKDRLKKCFDTCPDGFHFIIFVFSYTERVTPEESFAAEILIKEFGARFLTQQAICVFTHGENFDLERNMSNGPNFDIWYTQTQDPFLQEVAHNVKAFMFYNRQTDKMVPQRQKILEAVRNCRMYVQSNEGEHSSQQQEQRLPTEQSMKRNTESDVPWNTVSDGQSARMSLCQRLAEMIYFPCFVDDSK